VQSSGASVLIVVLLVGLWLLPFYVAWRIGKPKGRKWFWYVFFLGWIGVFILALLEPLASARTTGSGFKHHIPPGMRPPGTELRKRS
jgi:hypothetical protein